MSFTTLTTVSVYEEKKRPVKSWKDRSKLTWQSILGYLPVYPWINCEVSLDTFSGQFCGWKQPFDQLAIHSPFSRPTQHAAMPDGVRCIGLRSTLHRPSHRHAFPTEMLFCKKATLSSTHAYRLSQHMPSRRTIAQNTPGVRRLHEKRQEKGRLERFFKEICRKTWPHACTVGIIDVPLHSQSKRKRQRSSIRLDGDYSSVG